MIEFDPQKEAVNIAKHGVSLRLAEDIFFEEALIDPTELGRDSPEA